MPNQNQQSNGQYSHVAPLDAKYKVGIVGATGMVGQQLIRMLKDHPWMEITTMAASGSSAGKKYKDAVGERWCMDFAIPEKLAGIVVKDANEIAAVADGIDIVFCAVSASKDEVLKLEDAYAKAGVWLTSCNSAYRADPLVPMMIPAANAAHLDVIELQRKERNYGDGAIIVKSNCSIQSYVIALTPLLDCGIQSITVHSAQAVSGAGKTFDTWPEMVENLIPLIVNEEQKSEVEPLKVWGTLEKDGIKPTNTPRIKAKCVRVAVLDGHTAFTTVRFKDAPPSQEEVLKRWNNFVACTELPSAPSKFIHYRTEADRPQPALDVMTENGMAVTIGQLQVDQEEKTISFTALAHNTLLGAAGGAVLATEQAISKKLVKHRSALAAAH